MINDTVKNGYSSPTPVRASAPAASISTAEPTAAVDAQQAAAQPAVPAQPDKKQLQEAVSKLNDYVQNIRRNLSFSVEEATGRTVIRVYDSETDELIRQIPSEETLRLAEQIETQASSLLIEERA